MRGNVVYDTDASLANSCNGDVVNLQGKAHQIHHLNNAQTERDVVTTGTEFTFDASIHLSLELVSEGSVPNLIWDLTELTRIDDNGVTVTDVKYSLECRG